MGSQSPKIQLVYWSLPASDIPEGSAGFAFEPILQKARKHNVARAISSALMHAGGGFWQVLEGPQDEVEKAFAQIRADKRHSCVMELTRRFIKHRQFDGFPMAFIKDSAANRAVMQHHTGYNRPSPRLTPVDTIIEMMQACLHADHTAGAMAA